MTQETDGISWFDPATGPFALEGFAFFKTDAAFRRLPLHADFELPSLLDGLANHTAGGQIRFKAKYRKLAIKARLSPARVFYPQAAPSGQCGFDCYIGKEGAPRFHSITVFPKDADVIDHVLDERGTPEVQDVVIDFPLYSGVVEVRIGLDAEAVLMAPEPRSSSKKLIFYGTSITQGGFASRPGMAYPNILSRWLDIECINLGFASSGLGEPEVARIVAGIEDPACLVLDYEANCPDIDWLAKTMGEFVRIYRNRHPHVPILALSRIPFARDLTDEAYSEGREKGRSVIREIVDAFRRAGNGDIHFLDGGSLLGDHFEECTVDGVHPTDLGFMKMAEALFPVLQGLVSHTNTEEKN